MKRWNLVIYLTLLIVYGCGQNQQQKLKVTYLSDPPGGTLYKQNGETWGPCPKVLWYDLSEEARSAGKLQAKGLIVRWPSGPEKRSDDTITFQLDGKAKQFTFVQSDEEKTDQRASVHKDTETAAVKGQTTREDSGLREEPDEPDEETVQVVKTDTTENRNDGIIEKPGNADQIRSQRVEGIHEEPEGPQAEITETAITIDSAAGERLKQGNPNQMKSEPTPKMIEDPNEEMVKIKVETMSVLLGDGVEMEFVLIPAGYLDLKATGEDTDNKPTQRITISKSFYMGRFEVTQEQYETIMGVNPAHFTDDPNDPNHSNRPVETVSWYDADAFCRKLSAKLNLKFRLPTEAEWEYACRAGTTTMYYWGDDFDSRYAHTIQDRSSGPDNVGSRKQNDWGLYDMSGNVWEWCKDRYIDPDTLSRGDFRILRGGSWGNSQRSCGSAYRNWHTPNHRYDDCGFRVVMEVGSASK